MAKSAKKVVAKAKISKPASKSIAKKSVTNKKPVKKVPVKKNPVKSNNKVVKKQSMKPGGKKPVLAKKSNSRPSVTGKKIIKPVSKPVRKPAVTKKLAKPKTLPKTSKPVAKSKPATKQASKLKPAIKQVIKAQPASGKKTQAVKTLTTPVAPPAKLAPVAKAYAVAKAVAAPPTGKVGSKKGVIPIPMRKTESAAVPVNLPKGYKPSAKEPYMGPKQQEYFRQKLTHWREELVEESKQTIDNLRDEVRDVGDEAERATRETENSLELRTRDRYRKLIAKIDEALRRIDEGQYGYCIDTGDEIGLERLEARPTAERTVDAQERWEHRQKQMGE